MARVMLPADAARTWFDGRAEIPADGDTLFAVIRALDKAAPGITPGFAEVARRRYVFAVDGVLASDWSTPVGPDSEVLVVVKVAGG